MAVRRKTVKDKIHGKQVGKSWHPTRVDTAVRRHSHAGTDNTMCTCDSQHPESSQKLYYTSLEVFKTKILSPLSLPSHPNTAKLKSTAMVNRQLPFWFQYCFLPGWTLPYCWCLSPFCPLMTWVLATVQVCSERQREPVNSQWFTGKQTDIEGVWSNLQSLPSRKNLNWWPIWVQGFLSVFKYHLSWEVHITEMNRRPHWDLIREGWAGKWQFPCCFGPVLEPLFLSPIVLQLISCI